VGILKLIMFCCRVLQMGYNLLYGLQQASYDADCSLFLNILKEEVKVRAMAQSPDAELTTGECRATRRPQVVDDCQVMLAGCS